VSENISTTKGKQMQKKTRSIFEELDGIYSQMVQKDVTDSMPAASIKQKG
jgi:hypothetical protein